MNTEQHTVTADASAHHGNPSDNVKRIWKTFWKLLIITIIELGLGLTIYALNLPDDLKRLLIKGVIIILSLAKAYYIVSIFMHLGDEIKNLKMTIVIPLMLFLWFIFAFVYDGNSYKNLRNKYDKSFQERTTVENGKSITTPVRN